MARDEKLASLSMQLFVSSEILTPPLPPLVSHGNSLSSILRLSSTQGNNSVTRNGDQILFFWRNLKRGVTLVPLWIYSSC